MSEFELFLYNELSWLLYKNLSIRSWIFSVFCKELADKKYHTKSIGNHQNLNKGSSGQESSLYPKQHIFLVLLQHYVAMQISTNFRYVL